MSSGEETNAAEQVGQIGGAESCLFPQWPDRETRRGKVDETVASDVTDLISTITLYWESAFKIATAEGGPRPTFRKGEEVFVNL